MKVLLIGSGGREHALAWKLAQSPKLDALFIAPGNAGTAEAGENIALDVTDHAAVTDFCHQRGIDLVVIGPEAPLVAGLSDDLHAANIAVFGPSKAAAQLEGSKSFTKSLCDKMEIPTANYARFDNLAAARTYVRAQGAPIVIKADGLAAGKGVTVATTVAEAETALTDCFAGDLGAAGAWVVIEECLMGEEASVFAICDGDNFQLLATAQDHKRAYDGDAGPNTGGMGAYSPAPVVTRALLDEIGTRIIAPTLAGMNAQGMPFVGVLYAGLMITEQGPKLIEYNVRFGDPETQVLMMRLKSDLLPLLEAAASGNVAAAEIAWHPDAAITVVMATKGYPGAYRKGSQIQGLEAANAVEGVEIFHAGTVVQDDRLLAMGGRVLNVTARGTDLAEAKHRAYKAIGEINWPEGFCRRDIGWRALENSE